MPEKFYCDICNAPMKLKEKLPNHKHYRRRRFACTVCDFEKTIIAGGEGDEKYWPKRGIEDAEKIARQESKNREP